MAYIGNPANIGLPELESVRRLRESAEGGPGSGPQGGKTNGGKKKGDRVTIKAGPHQGKMGTIVGSHHFKGEGRVPGSSFHLVKIDGVEGKPQTFAHWNVE